jgi:hypothetical protein
MTLEVDQGAAPWWLSARTIVIMVKLLNRRMLSERSA